MERCTLCGGRLADGKCTECGLDNTKNDKKYRLNVHNEKSVAMHLGDCEEHLNRDSDWRERLRGKQKELSDTYAQKREQRLRGQTGTVRKQVSLLRVIVWLIIALAALGIAGAIIGTVADFGRGIFEELSIALRSGSSGEEKEIPAEPEPAGWDENSENYFKLELAPGFYQAGYEFPPGDYQFVCLEGSADLYWSSADGESADYVCLYGTEQQESYEKLFEEPCPYFSRSEVVTLEDGAVVWADSEQTGTVLAGEAPDPEAVRPRGPQGLAGTVTLGDGMTAGKDFEAGIYDAVLDGPENTESYAAAYLEIRSQDDTGGLYVNLGIDRTKYLRVPFSEGDTAEVKIYGEEDCRILLVPSY